MKKIYKPKRKKINKIGIVNDKEESVLFLFSSITNINKVTGELFPSTNRYSRKKFY